MKKYKKRQNPSSDNSLERVIAVLKTATEIIEKQNSIISLLEKELKVLEVEKSNLERKGATHSIELMFQAFYLQQLRIAEKKSNKRLKRLSDFDALLKANEILKVYPPKYLMQDSYRETKEFGKIITSYTKNYKGKFKQEFGLIIQSSYLSGFLKDSPIISKQG